MKCPKCEVEFNEKGFTDSGVPVLWYCSCGAIIANSKFGLIEISQEEVDLGKIQDWYVDLSVPEKQQFIMFFRWKKAREKIWDFISKTIENYAIEKRAGRRG